MSNYASKGVGVTGLTLGSVALGSQVLNGGLGGLFGNNTAQAEKISALEAKLAESNSRDYTNQSVLELYRSTEAQFKERDTVLTGVIVEAARNDERNKCQAANIAKLELRIEKLETASCDNRVAINTLNGSINALAADTAAQIDKVMCFVEKTYVPGELRLPITSICPEPKAA